MRDQEKSRAATSTRADGVVLIKFNKTPKKLFLNLTNHPGASRHPSSAEEGKLDLTPREIDTLPSRGTALLLTGCSARAQGARNPHTPGCTKQRRHSASRPSPSRRPVVFRL